MTTPSQETNSLSPCLQNIVKSVKNYDPNALSVHQAQQIIRALITPIHFIEHLPLQQTLGRVLGENIISPINVPTHDNSAMDGYAFDGATLNAENANHMQLRIVGTAYAGHPFTGNVSTGDCVRIMTGATMPTTCDTVVPQEMVEQIDKSLIRFSTHKMKRGDNRRFAGEDLKKNSIALERGKVLFPADMGLLASLGIHTVPLQRRLRVAFISTGDELRALDQTLDAGCVYDSNRYTIYGMLTRLGCEVIDMGIIADNPAAIRLALQTAAESADAIITSGGVSVGAADYTKQIMAELGDVAFWTIGMRPGRPMAFGSIQSNGKSAYLFGLPGNPVAVMVTFYFFVRQALQHLMGAKLTTLPLIPAITKTFIRKRQGRTEYQRGIASTNHKGQLEVRLTGGQGSGILSSMTAANCMLILNDDQSDIVVDQTVNIILFDGLL